MPKPSLEKRDEVFDLDPELRPDEQAYVNHYLGYADLLLGAPEPAAPAAIPEPRPTNVIELPRMQDTEEPGDGKGNAA